MHRACLPVALALCLITHWMPGGDAHLLCPPINETISDGTDSCTTECYKDAQCVSESDRNDSLCCSTSACGQQCLTGLTIPYHPPVLQCPELDPDTSGACYEGCGGGEDGGNCTGDQLCCSNGCGHSCTTGEQVTPVCQTIVESHNGTLMVGEYAPQCSESGEFTPVQCHGSTGYCWCVRPDTGVPVGRTTTRFSQPECNSCFHNGKVYYPGDTFDDDCNTCFCSEDGNYSCTEIGCNLPDDTFTSPFYSCPVLEDGAVGICSEECSSDEDCNSDQKCCSNGCGHTCADPVPIPFIAPPRECPEDYDEEHAVCDIQECSDSCEDRRELCCQNTCGSLLCVEGQLPPYPCTQTVNSLTGGALLGQYIPRCNEEDGTFRALQCSSHYCWCVDEENGEPTSDMREDGDVGELECSRCYVETEVFEHGEVVETYGECEKRTCLGGELVWSGACDTCEYNGKIYEHGEHTDNCGLCTCLDGGVACAESESFTPCPTHCNHRGFYHLSGDVFPEGDGCNTCFCSSSYDVTCTSGECEEEDSDDMEWWHSFLIGAGTLIAVLAVIATGLLVVMVMMIRSGQFRHKRLHDNSETLSFGTDTQILFKNGPPEAESVELKVPVEGDEIEPVET